MEVVEERLRNFRLNHVEKQVLCARTVSLKAEEVLRLEETVKKQSIRETGNVVDVTKRLQSFHFSHVILAICFVLIALNKAEPSSLD